MSEIDFSDLGREIGEKVEKFVNSKEIKDLQANIKATVETTISEARRSAKEAADYRNKNVGITPPVKAYVKRQLPVIRNPKGSVSGVLMTVLGTAGAVIGWTIAFGGYSLTLLTKGLFGMGVYSVGFSAAIAGVCTIVAIAGGFLRRRAKRFKKYVNTMGPKDFYSIKGLAEAVREKEKFVIKDLKRMIRQGWFKEGHLDGQGTCFMLTNQSYKMYLDAQEELARRKAETERQARERELLEQDPEKKQLVMVIEEGKEYIRRIREINDDIPGEEISKKLYRLEKICTRIFEHIKDKPEKMPDIRKFMSYYLPTTLKLVEAYHEFSLQPVQGENIATGKKEIEEMLDDINGAFEKMFDKLFEDDALDVSTDISVLSALLAQEGLLEDDFKYKEKGD